jgi:hypothetical integral membrane protein (TIGR02206 family)
MATDFTLFGPAHLGILASIPAGAGLLTWWSCRQPQRTSAIRLAVGGFLLLTTLSWHLFSLLHGWTAFPSNLPLALCDATLALTILAALRLSAWAYDLAYYGAFGALLAVITPDLWAPFPSYPTIQFFISHCGIVVAVMFLAWSNLLKPRAGSAWKAFTTLNAFGLSAGIFNYCFGSNYLYLSAKPSSATTALAYLGPWPLYTLAGEIIALAAFTLLWLPFRRADVPAQAHAAFLGRGRYVRDLSGLDLGSAS